MEILFGALAFLPAVLIFGWGVELIRRLGDQTKLLRQIADDVGAIRRSTEPA